MRTVWQSLAWKEWHEHKWKLAAISAILCGVSAVALAELFFVDGNARESFAGFLPALVMGMIPLSMFLAVGEAAGENSNRTMPFLQSLPVPMWKVAVCKLLFGASTCLLPILFTLLFVSGTYYLAEAWGDLPRSIPQFEGLRFLEAIGIHGPLLAWNVIVFTLTATVALSFYIWTASMGVNRKSEVAAGGMGLLIIVSWWTAVGVILNVTGSKPDNAHFATTCLMASSPGGLPLLLVDDSSRLPRWISLAIVVALASHAALVVWFVRRFGRTANVGSFSPQIVAHTASKRAWLGPPRRSPLRAIVWKQFRESGPIVIAGLAAILFFFAVSLLVDANYYSNHRQQEVQHLLLGLTMNIGFLVTLIVGIGVFDRDLSPKLHTFWRSRPIDPNLWYWTKFLTGLAALATALLLPIAGSFLYWHWNSFLGYPIDGVELSMAASLLLAVYALAATTLCLVRVTIYAAILSAGTVAIGALAVWMFLDKQPTDIFAITVTMGLTVAVLATLVGWWAVRRDVGWKK